MTAKVKVQKITTKTRISDWIKCYIAKIAIIILRHALVLAALTVAVFLIIPIYAVQVITNPTQALGTVYIVAIIYYAAQL